MNSEKPQAKALRPEEMSDAIVVSFEAKWQEKLDSQLVDIVIRKRVPKDRSFRWIYFHINSPVSSICGRARIVRIGNLSSHDILAFSDRIGLTEKEILSYIDGRDEIAFYEINKFDGGSKPGKISDLNQYIRYTPPQSFVILSNFSKKKIDSICGFRNPIS
jgi:predicted transcriptional regulator